MLKLARRVGETIVIDEQIVITIDEIRGSRTFISIQCARAIPVRRGEVPPRDTPPTTVADPHPPG